MLDEAQGLALFAEAVQGGRSHPAPPALILVAEGPSVGVVVGAKPINRSRILFFLWYSGSGGGDPALGPLPAHPTGANVARMASPLTRLWVRPSSKLAWAAIWKVHRLAILAEVPGTLV